MITLASLSAQDIASRVSALSHSAATGSAASVRQSETTLPTAQPSSVSTQVDMLDEIQRKLEEDADYQLIKRMLLKEQYDDVSWQNRTATETLESTYYEMQAGAASFTHATEITGLGLQTNLIQIRIHVAEGVQQVLARFEQTELFLHMQMEEEPQQADPLVLDLGGSGIQTTGVQNGVWFDLTGDGQMEKVSFVTGDSWFLALDRNQNGIIDDGRELFGDQHGAAHGFAELARFDANQDGVIDQHDAVFAKLLLFSLAADGSQRTQTLTQANISAIHLGYQNTQKFINAYDEIAQLGHFERSDGSLGQAADVLLAFQRA